MAINKNLELQQAVTITNTTIANSAASFYVKYMKDKYEVFFDFDEAKTLAFAYISLPLKELYQIVIGGNSPLANYVVALRDIRGEDE